jgi:hypothetical protein
LALYAEVARRLWLRHNGVLHGEVFHHPRVLLCSASSYIEDDRHTMAREENTTVTGMDHGSAELTHWRSRCFKVN